MTLRLKFALIMAVPLALIYVVLNTMVVHRAHRNDAE